MKLTEIMQQLETLTVAEITQQIEALEARIKELTEPLLRERDGLLRLRQMVNIRVNGAPQRKTRKPKAVKSAVTTAATSKAAAREETEDAVEQPAAPISKDTTVGKVHDYLHASGPMTIKGLENALTLSYAAVHSAVERRPDVFERTPNGKVKLRGRK